MVERDVTAYLGSGKLFYRHIPSRDFPGGQNEDGSVWGGKTYVVKSPDIDTVLWIKALTMNGVNAYESGGRITAEDLAKSRLDDREEADLYEKVLGATGPEMRADGVAGDDYDLIALDAYISISVAPQVADFALAARGAEGNAPARPNRATRRAPAKTTGTRATRKTLAGSKSSPASSDTPAQTPRSGSTRSSTSAPRKPRAPKD